MAVLRHRRLTFAAAHLYMRPFAATNYHAALLPKPIDYL
jgi:hypothetical protein